MTSGLRWPDMKPSSDVKGELSGQSHDLRGKAVLLKLVELHLLCSRDPGKLNARRQVDEHQRQRRSGDVEPRERDCAAIWDSIAGGYGDRVARWQDPDPALNATRNDRAEVEWRRIDDNPWFHNLRLRRARQGMSALCSREQQGSGQCQSQEMTRKNFHQLADTASTYDSGNLLW
jgi:hypothetical protein